MLLTDVLADEQYVVDTVSADSFGSAPPDASRPDLIIFATSVSPEEVGFPGQTTDHSRNERDTRDCAGDAFNQWDQAQASGNVYAVLPAPFEIDQLMETVRRALAQEPFEVRVQSQPTEPGPTSTGSGLCASQCRARSHAGLGATGADGGALCFRPGELESGGHYLDRGRASRSAVSHCQPHSRRTRAGSADSAASDVSAAACLSSGSDRLAPPPGGGAPRTPARLGSAPARTAAAAPAAWAAGPAASRDGSRRRPRPILPAPSGAAPAGGASGACA